jgi:hypothetical protein
MMTHRAYPSDGEDAPPDLEMDSGPDTIQCGMTAGRAFSGFSPFLNANSYASEPLPASPSPPAQTDAESDHPQQIQYHDFESLGSMHSDTENEDLGVCEGKDDGNWDEDESGVDEEFERMLYCAAIDNAEEELHNLGK